MGAKRPAATSARHYQAQYSEHIQLRSRTRAMGAIRTALTMHVAEGPWLSSSWPFGSMASRTKSGGASCIVHHLESRAAFYFGNGKAGGWLPAGEVSHTTNPDFGPHLALSHTAAGLVPPGAVVPSSPHPFLSIVIY
eukprot:scaffold21372_cov129-Isochrysis_galbana.AAC.1